MAAAVTTSLESGQHLLVQAGTGTGKSLGYLVPALVRLVRHPGERVVVATATLALQAQLATKDIPVAVEAVEAVTGTRPAYSILKGRGNYACLLKVREGVGAEQDSLLGGEDVVTALRARGADPVSVVGAEVVALREWAEGQASARGVADRDDAPTHTAAAWAQVSVPARECLGVQRCPFGSVCFVERAREEARVVSLVVTNHSLLAVDAMQEGAVLPPHDVVIIDEAHELTSRVTSAASLELSPQQLERTARRALPWLSDELGLEFLETADLLRGALDEAPVARVEEGSATLEALGRIRDTCRHVVSALGGGDGKDVDRVQCAAAVAELFDVTAAMAVHGDQDVCWVLDRERFGRELRQAPLSVAGLMRARVLAERPVVMTSATLTVGGDFGVSARSVGLSAGERVEHPGDLLPPGEEPDDRLAWAGIDVGSPFDYGRQGILYIARDMAPPRREGISGDALDEIARLVEAAGGRALGLFASLRAAETAATHVRAACPDLTVLCQGDAQLAELTRRFAAEPETSLFGTLSLWQGVDVPGETCELVIIDKIPFPRPDDPLHVARQQAVSAAGGNGFMSIAAAHAGLLLAQGAGRLIRRSSDRGLVAVLDPRLLTARYGSFLRASLPPFWTTTDSAVAISALQRLRETRP
ncbi:ATP-dependent DNA helicase [Propionicicella superfundia]|uniref:ATP-dependent DNA helicase n=1 Tax=Propionicicella superfundia TaxID=348582 RepID=UPI000A02F846|nr:ATP-dependent DNA helicase [Propionicicella superfundia]